MRLKPGASLDDLNALNRQFGITATEPVYPKMPSPEDYLRALKHQLAKFSPDHHQWS